MQSSHRVRTESKCYDRATPRDGNTHAFSKERTNGGASAQRGSAQGQSTIKQALDRRQNDSLLRQRNNESSSQEQTPRERQIREPREGGVRNEYRRTPTTADRHRVVPAAADQRLTAETCTQTITTRPKAMESRPQNTTTRPMQRLSRPQDTTARSRQWGSRPR
jgi:hypothetical protein